MGPQYALVPLRGLLQWVAVASPPALSAKHHLADRGCAPPCSAKRAVGRASKLPATLGEAQTFLPRSSASLLQGSRPAAQMEGPSHVPPPDLTWRSVVKGTLSSSRRLHPHPPPGGWYLRAMSQALGRSPAAPTCSLIGLGMSLFYS